MIWGYLHDFGNLQYWRIQTTTNTIAVILAIQPIIHLGKLEYWPKYFGWGQLPLTNHSSEVIMIIFMDHFSLPAEPIPSGSDPMSRSAQCRAGPHPQGLNYEKWDEKLDLMMI